MEKKVTMSHALSVHLRAAKELHHISPKFFLLTTIYSIVAAVTPYITVFFSERTGIAAQSGYPAKLGRCRCLVCWTFFCIKSCVLSAERNRV